MSKPFILVPKHAALLEAEVKRLPGTRGQSCWVWSFSFFLLSLSILFATDVQRVWSEDPNGGLRNGERAQAQITSKEEIDGLYYLSFELDNPPIRAAQEVTRDLYEDSQTGDSISILYDPDHRARVSLTEGAVYPSYGPYLLRLIPPILILIALLAYSTYNFYVWGQVGRLLYGKITQTTHYRDFKGRWVVRFTYGFTPLQGPPQNGETSYPRADLTEATLPKIGDSVRVFYLDENRYRVL